jgi:hypothetical protein
MVNIEIVINNYGRDIKYYISWREICLLEIDLS